MPVLTSLKKQMQNGDRVALFQDGHWNPHIHDHSTYGSKVDECISIFRGLFPYGELFTSPTNVGIAANYRRAETYAFDVLGCDEALFLEDDLVLSPFYLDTISDLLQIARANSRIGYVSAYGDLWAPISDQARGLGHNVAPMHENWGSAMTKDSWKRQAPFREFYWNMIKDQDYSNRNSEIIGRAYDRRGYSNAISSQDFSRWCACSETGMVRITTKTCQARYIGKVGLHFYEEYFNKLGFDRARWFPRKADVHVPTLQEIDLWFASERKGLEEGYIHPYHKRLEQADVP